MMYELTEAEIRHIEKFRTLTPASQGALICSWTGFSLFKLKLIALRRSAKLPKRGKIKIRPRC